MNFGEKHTLKNPSRAARIHRDFTLLFASMFSLLAGAALSPALPAMATHFSGLEHVDTLVKLTLSITALFIAIGCGIAGYLIDRFGRKAVLVGGILITGIAGTSGSVLDSLYLILGSRVLLGLGVAAVITSATTLIGDVFSGDQRTRFFGLQAAAMKAGGIVFLLIGGALSSFGWRAAFLVDLLAFSILPGVIWSFDSARDHVAANNKIRGTLRWTNKTVIVSLFASFASQLFFYMVPTQIPFHIANIAHGSPKEIGIAIALNVGSSAIAASQFHRLINLTGIARLYALAFLLMAAGYFLVSYATSLGDIMFALSISGLGLGTIFPCASSSLVEVVGEEQRGRAIGLLMTVTFAGQFVSPLFFAPLVQHVGIGNTFLVASAALVICALAVASTYARQAKSHSAPVHNRDS